MSDGGAWPTRPSRWAVDALQRLRSGRERSIPVMRQLSPVECGATCLAMVLAYHGRHVRRSELAEDVGVGRDGAGANAIMQSARRHGLRTRAVRLDLDKLSHLQPGAILHWELNHFVVFERLLSDAVQIVDPAFGRRRVTLAQFSRAFSGVALLCERGERFVPLARGPSLLGHWLLSIMRGRDFYRVLALSVTLQLLTLAAPLFTGTVVDTVIPHADVHLLSVLSIAAAAAICFHFLAHVTRSSLLLQLRTRVDAQLSTNFFEHLISLPYAFFQRHSSGALLNRLANNTAVREFLTSSVLSVFLDGGIALGAFGLLLALHPALGGCAFLLGVLHLVVFLSTRGRLGRLMAEDLRAQARVRGCEVDLLQGIADLKILGSEPNAVSMWSNHFVDTLNASLARGRLMIAIDGLLGSLRIGSPLAMLLIGTAFVLDGGLSVGSLLALNGLAANFLSALVALVSTLSQAQILGAYLDQLNEVFSTAREVELESEQSRASLRGELSIEALSFRYSKHGRDVLKDVSLQIRPGEIVAIVGPSGSGKSTLASLLLGLYEPTAGRILYDGRDLRAFEPRALRRKVGVVLQRPHLFTTSIRGNIALAEPDLPLARLQEAAEAADIHRDIMAMPMQYETLISDDGATLSGGQRQRIALARALVHDPAILVLDEATSALDTRTEAVVQANLEKLRCTRIVIAHRLSTVVHADRIIVLEEGSVVEQGSHSELTQRQGVYARLLAAQLLASQP